MKKSSLTVLNNLAALKCKYDMDELEKPKIESIVKIRGSTLRNAFADLKKQSLIEVNGKKVSITKKGMSMADTSSFDDIKIPTTNEEKHNEIRKELKPNEVKLFDAMIDGHVHDKEELREKLGMKKNSTWRNMVAKLITLNIAENAGKGSIQLTKNMFPIVPRPTD